MLNMIELMKFLMLRMDWTFNCKSGAFANVDMRMKFTAQIYRFSMITYLQLPFQVPEDQTLVIA